MQSTTIPSLPAPKLPARCQQGQQSSSSAPLVTPKQLTFAYVTCINHIVAYHATDPRRPHAATVVPVYDTFGGEHMGDAGNTTLCMLTWNCDPAHQDIHPNDAGYRLIASAVERSLPPPVTNPLNLLTLASGGAKQGKLEEHA